METKKCSKCNEVKFHNLFSKKKASKDGLAAICKSCHKKYRREHYLKNKNKVYEQVYQYRKDNPEKYEKKFNCKPNKKAGRTIKKKCSNEKCKNIVFLSKTEINNKVKRMCSRKCKYETHSIFTKIINDKKKRAKRKNLDFDITKEFLEDLLINKQNGKCVITNVPLKFTDKTKIYETPSLDRIDNNKGYTKNNVQWVMLGINYMKLNHPNNDLKKALKLIVENYK